MRMIATAAAALLAACASAGATDVTGARSQAEVSLRQVAKLQHDPREVLAIVARRMGIRLRPNVPLPRIYLESRTPLSRLQRVAERQWSIRPREFMNVYAADENAIYLIDSAKRHARTRSTVDGALAHELVHYLQASYRKDGFATEWSEVEALSVQAWFRKQHIATTVAADTGALAP